jgi:undecaprenyl diphosphate synthase
MKNFLNILMPKKGVLNIDLNRLPKHIAIIMDGNGRWAQKRALPRTLGHRAGVEALKEIIKYSGEIGIKYLSLYAFSTENWSRPNQEVSALMDLLVEFLNKEAQNLHKNNVRINVLGDLSRLPKLTYLEVIKALDLTSNNTGINLNIALNYGGRAEILRAVKGLAKDIKAGVLNIDDIEEPIFQKYLYTGDIPDPDLVIRPSGELRLSNFLLWQIAYSEFWFSDVLWPDFKPRHLNQAISDYQKRDRRFGTVKGGK